MPSGTTSLDVGLLLLRLAAGGFLLPHGLAKLLGWFGGPGLSGFAGELRQFGLPSAAPIPLLIAASQVLLGAALVLGCLTRSSAVAAAGLLAVTVVFNAAKGWFWMRGGMEYPLFWTLVILAIALTGPGSVSIDHYWR